MMFDQLDRQQEQDDAPPPLTWKRIAPENEILCVLDARPRQGEQLELAFRRKEAELMTLFASMSVADSRELHRRLNLGLPGDQIAERFKRLVALRRARLLAFVADARRRSAVGRR